VIKSLRWRLTWTFIGLSSLVCIALAFVGAGYLHAELTASLDEQLRVMASEFGHAIDVKPNQTPYFRDWKRVVQTDPPRSLGTIQLFSADGKLLESYGRKGIPQLLSQREARLGEKRMRIRSTPLEVDGKLVGYMQLQLSTADRDEALRDLWIMFGALAPLMLLGLGVTSYFVSGKAVRPLEQNIEQLRAFLADAGHELNTPLAIIRARAESLERKLQRQGLETGDVKVIANSAERTTRLANDLMFLAEVESVGPSRRLQPVDLQTLLSQVIQDFSARFEEKRIKATVECAPGTVWGNTDELYRAFANLLENAVRYTEDGGTIKVTMQPGEGAFNIAIEDTGIGIPAENLPLLFNRFYRVDPSRSRKSGGFGLGLSIVKAIVEAHDGVISVSSTVGVGTKFTVVLPTRIPKNAMADSANLTKTNAPKPVIE
jgi:two-component system, OmpR family, manganese sensing sensor histidine kinase